MVEPRRLLILGGTAEAAALAHRLARHSELAVTTSLAGRTRDPVSLPGAVRVGGFGGTAGLAGYLARHRVDLVIDATHPFAARISANAVAACAAQGVPRLVLTRPAWRPQRSDRWIGVPDAGAARVALPALGRRAFLSIGRQELAAFAEMPEMRFLVRLIDAPDDDLPLANYDLVLGRGPFATGDEVALLSDYGIAAVVTKNSGGVATYGKIEAARRLGLPVLMIERPPPPPGEQADAVEAAVAWVEAQAGAD